MIKQNDLLKFDKFYIVNINLKEYPYFKKFRKYPIQKTEHINF